MSDVGSGRPGPDYSHHPLGLDFQLDYAISITCCLTGPYEILVLRTASKVINSVSTLLSGMVEHNRWWQRVTLTDVPEGKGVS